MKTIVAIKDDINGDETIGSVEHEVEVGHHVEVSLRNENGVPIKATGTVTEILEERDY